MAIFLLDICQRWVLMYNLNMYVRVIDLIQMSISTVHFFHDAKMNQKHLSHKHHQIGF